MEGWNEQELTTHYSQLETRCRCGAILHKLPVLWDGESGFLLFHELNEVFVGAYLLPRHKNVVVAGVNNGEHMAQPLHQLFLQELYTRDTALFHFEEFLKYERHYFVVVFLKH